jgi:hypothetical protein
MSKTFIINIEPFGYKLHILHCVSDKRFLSYAMKVFNIKVERDLINFATTHIVKDERFQECIIDFRTELPHNRLSYDLIAHESLHVVFEIARFAEFRFCPDSEEIYAYLQGYITSQICSKLFLK